MVTTDIVPLTLPPISYFISYKCGHCGQCPECDSPWSPVTPPLHLITWRTPGTGHVLLASAEQGKKLFRLSPSGARARARGLVLAGSIRFTRFCVICALGRVQSGLLITFILLTAESSWGCAPIKSVMSGVTLSECGQPPYY